MCYSILVEQDTKRLASRFEAKLDQVGFDEYRANTKVDPKKFKPLAEHPRIYPNYYAPIMVRDKQGERLLTPMRYRLRTRWADKEVPTKYNLFNCRMDAIEKRRSWQPIFMKQHGVLVFKKFFEWVEDEETGKKKVVSFSPKDQEYIVCPVLYEIYQDAETRIISFAVITTDPNPEVLAAGHDRSPVFLKEQYIDQWLNPKEATKEQIYAMLQDSESTYYLCEAA